MENGVIYHIAVLKGFRTEIKNGEYSPESLSSEGFIHCTKTPATVLLVAEDYFKEVEGEIIILKIDLARVKHEVRFEAAAPLPGKGADAGHLKEEILFPHIYGALNLDSVLGYGLLRSENGKFLWPEDFRSNLPA